jgi:very-short-patch-repair endonuclease
MIEFEKHRFRKRYYELEKVNAKKNNIESLHFEAILKLRSKLNRNNYGSEVWFKKILFSHFEDNKKLVKCFLNYPVLNRYFIDFYFNKYKIGIEIDGNSHEGKESYDQQRDAKIMASGINVLRIRSFNKPGAIKVLNILDSLINKQKIDHADLPRTS